MTVRTGTPDDKTVVATVTVEATRERVFAAFTDPAELAAWFWPARFETTYRLDVREGGEFHVRSDAVDLGVHGRYLEVSPPARLAMTWCWDGEDEHSHVLIELTEAGTDAGTETDPEADPEAGANAGTETGFSAATIVTVTHSANATVEVRDAHAQGWRDCIGRLAEHTFG